MRRVLLPLFSGVSSDALPLELLSRHIRPLAEPPKDKCFYRHSVLAVFDGRGANKSWLCEAPDPLTLVSWQSVVQVHPETMAAKGWKQGDVVELRSLSGILQAPVFDCPGIHPGVMAMAIGQGHTAFGRNARNQGRNPLAMFDAGVDPVSGGPSYLAHVSAAGIAGQKQVLAHLDGSRVQHGRKIALATALKNIQHPSDHANEGLGMWEFPLTLPLPEGYDAKRDIYPRILTWITDGEWPWIWIAASDAVPARWPAMQRTTWRWWAKSRFSKEEKWRGCGLSGTMIQVDPKRSSFCP